MNIVRFNRLLCGTLMAAALCAATTLWAQDSTSSPVVCKDGTSAAHGGRGACSGHGGINKSASAGASGASAAAAPPAAAASTPASPAPAAPASPAVTCKDGTTAAHGGRGACSGHGGVNKSAAAG